MLKFIGIFPSNFPGWGSGTPHVHERSEIELALLDIRPGTPTYTRAKEVGRPCTMFQTPRGDCLSVRYIPQGVSAVDDEGNVWCLVDDQGQKSEENY